LNKSALKKEVSSFESYKSTLCNIARPSQQHSRLHPSLLLTYLLTYSTSLISTRVARSLHKQNIAISRLVCPLSVKFSRWFLLSVS